MITIFQRNKVKTIRKDCADPHTVYIRSQGSIYFPGRAAEALHLDDTVRLLLGYDETIKEPILFFQKDKTGDIRSFPICSSRGKETSKICFCRPVMDILHIDYAHYQYSARWSGPDATGWFCITGFQKGPARAKRKKKD